MNFSKIFLSTEDSCRQAFIWLGHVQELHSNDGLQAVKHSFRLTTCKSSIQRVACKSSNRLLLDHLWELYPKNNLQIIRPSFGLTTVKSSIQRIACKSSGLHLAWPLSKAPSKRWLSRRQAFFWRGYLQELHPKDELQVIFWMEIFPSKRSSTVLYFAKTLKDLLLLAT